MGEMRLAVRRRWWPVVGTGFEFSIRSVDYQPFNPVPSKPSISLILVNIKSMAVLQSASSTTLITELGRICLFSNTASEQLVNYYIFPVHNSMHFDIFSFY